MPSRPSSLGNSQLTVAAQGVGGSMTPGSDPRPARSHNRAPARKAGPAHPRTPRPAPASWGRHIRGPHRAPAGARAGNSTASRVRRHEASGLRPRRSAATVFVQDVRRFFIRRSGRRFQLIQTQPRRHRRRFAPAGSRPGRNAGGSGTRREAGSSGRGMDTQERPDHLVLAS